MAQTKFTPLQLLLLTLITGLLLFAAWSIFTYWPMITGYHTRILKKCPGIPEKLPHNMILIHGGSFRLGSSAFDREAEENELPGHWVTVDPYYLGQYEVTFSEYDLFCQATQRRSPNDNGWGRDNRPAIDITWIDAVSYCNWLSAQEGLQPCYDINGEQTRCHFDRNGYRLPSEAEWEFAASGYQFATKNQKKREQEEPPPTRYRYPGSDNASEVAWFMGNSGGQTHPVGQLKPNSLGLFDMGGNVREWCWDRYEEYHWKYEYNPRGPEKGLFRVERGGRWDGVERDCRPRVRWWDPILYRHDILGFRLARTACPNTTE